MNDSQFVYLLKSDYARTSPLVPKLDSLGAMIGSCFDFRVYGTHERSSYSVM